MLIKKIIHIILLFALVLQFLPGNQYGWFLFCGMQDEECTELNDFLKSKLRVTEEEQHKDYYLDNAYLKLELPVLSNYLFELSERIPSRHFSRIPEPPPNHFPLI